MRMWFGLICLALAAFNAWAMIVAGLEPDAPYGQGGGGKLLVCALYGSVFWLMLAGGYSAMVAGGGLDWLAIGRGWQNAITFVVAFGIAITMVLASGLHTEPVDQIPYVFQPVIRWAMFVLPVVALAAGLLPLDPGWRNVLPTALARGPQVATGFVVIAIGVGLPGQLVVDGWRRDADRAQEEIADARERDQRFLEEVKAADPVHDFGSLLGRTGIYMTPETRNLALEKLKTNPNFTNDLVSALRNEWRGEAMTYVAWNDVPEPDKVAPAARDAIEAMANDAREEMQEAHYLWDDYFDGRSERILAAADRLSGHGVDLVPAVRAFRAALDEPRPQKINPRCRRNLDAWLNRNGASG